MWVLKRPFELGSKKCFADSSSTPEHQDSSLTENCPSESRGWLEKQRVCYGLSENVPLQANLFGHLVPNWWYCFERLQTLDVGNNWSMCYPSSVLSSVSSASCLLQQCDVSATSSLHSCLSHMMCWRPLDLWGRVDPYLSQTCRVFHHGDEESDSQSAHESETYFSIGTTPSAYLPSRFSIYWLTFTPIESALTPSCYLSL